MQSPIFRLLNRFRWEYEKLINIRNCKSWELAKMKSQTYGDRKLFERNIAATQKVLKKDVGAAYSQDGFIFSKMQKSPHWLNFISQTMNGHGPISVLDFGGGFADKFLQYQNEISNSGSVRFWNVVEQEAYVTAGKCLELMPKIVKFYPGVQLVPLEEGLEEIAIFAGSICYVENSLEILNYALSRKPKHIFIDRTPFGVKRKILNPAVQTWTSSGDTFSYPIWIFNESKFLDLFKGSYLLRHSWREKPQISYRCSHKGFLFSRVD